jgi:hypothetical protein
MHGMADTVRAKDFLYKRGSFSSLCETVSQPPTGLNWTFLCTVRGTSWETTIKNHVGSRSTASSSLWVPCLSFLTHGRNHDSFDVQLTHNETNEEVAGFIQELIAEGIFAAKGNPVSEFGRVLWTST